MTFSCAVCFVCVCACVHVCEGALCVYNICYIKGCTNMLSFLEVLLFNASGNKVTPAVKHYYSNGFAECLINQS